MNELAQPSGAGGPSPIPHLRPHPGSVLFSRRAERLRTLAQGHSLGDFLGFCGRLSAAQAVAAGQVTMGEDGCEKPCVRPLDASAPQSHEWMQGLRTIIGELASTSMPVPAREGLGRLASLPQEDVMEFSRRILRGDFAGLDLAAVPFAAAALQVYFAACAVRISPSTVEPLTEPGCPLCGSPPVAGLVLGDEKLRYLVCALCGSQWYFTRLKCAHCASTAGISYFSLEGNSDGVKAEVCEACRRYLKLFYLEQRPAAEPVADDLATFAIDLLVCEKGYCKSGINLFLPT